MLYTTYFAKLRSLPDNVIPISICAKAPEWYDGIQYKKLAPKFGFFKEWKKTHDNEYYVQHFNEEVLAPLDTLSVVNELQVALPEEIKKQMSSPFWRNKNWHVALVCYEKPTDFCHRHLVAEWLSADGFQCTEWGSDET